MGIFSDKCQALIDPKTGRALSGKALEQARQDADWPVCDNTVRKAARFCNTCGSPAPGGWWKCPSCHKWVGNDSQFCPHCNQPLYPESRADIAGGVWRKQPGVFAQRFEIGDVKRLLKNDLLVQTGTVALLMDGGQFRGILEAGRHNPDSLARAINRFGNPPPRSVVLVDAGDVILPVRLESLRTSEGLPIEFYGELIVRFGNDKKSAIAFLENRLKDAEQISYHDVTSPFEPEIRHAVDTMCVKSTVEDLVRDPERRLRLQDELDRHLREGLARQGLELVRVSSAEFTGEEYEDLAEKMGEVEQKRREIEYDQQMRSLLSKDQMDQFHSEQELADYQAAIAHEYGIADDKRNREREQIHRAWGKQDELDDLRHTVQIESEKLEHDLGVSVKRDDYERDKQVKDAETSTRVRDVQFGQEKRETEWAMELRSQKDEQKADMADRDAKRRSSMSEIELIADIQDPEARKALLEVMRVKAQDGKTPEQILAAAASESPAAADALARMQQNSEEKYREMLEEMRSLYRDTGERQERNLKTTIEPATEAAKNPGSNQNIVK